MEFEDILVEVGDWGWFQKFLVACYGLCVSLMGPFPGMASIFMVMTPKHQCYVPPSMRWNETFDLNTNSSCRMSISSILVNESVTKETNCIYGWQFDKTDYDATAATKWNMVCENSHYPSLILTFQNVGSLIGTTIYGILADRFGRKVVCFSLLILACTTDLASVFVSSVYSFTVLRILQGSVYPAMFCYPYILISEFMSPNKRVLVNGVFNMGWTAGMCVLPLVAYLTRDWVILGIICAASAAAVLPYCLYVPESASWLLSRGRVDDALDVMTQIGRRNGQVVNEVRLSKQLKDLEEKIRKEKSETKQHFFTLLKYPRLRKHFLILTFSWMSNSMSYMGFQYNVINLAGNVFLNFFLLSLVEAPGNAVLWVMMERLGRRWSATIGYIGITLCCLLPLTDIQYSDTASSILGKFIASGMYMVVDQQGCEIFPTVARSRGIGTGKSFAMAVSMFSPFLAYLGKYGKMIPFLLIGTLSLVAACLSSFLPETLNENLPQSFLDAEEFGKDQKYFSFNRKKDSVQEKPNADSEKLNTDSEKHISDSEKHNFDSEKHDTDFEKPNTETETTRL